MSSHLHISPVEELHRLGTVGYYVTATNSRNVLSYAIPFMYHTTLGCKEVLVQFLPLVLSCSCSLDRKLETLNTYII